MQRYSTSCCACSTFMKSFASSLPTARCRYAAWVLVFGWLSLSVGLGASKRGAPSLRGWWHLSLERCSSSTGLQVLSQWHGEGEWTVSMHHKFDSLSSFPNVILTTWVGWSKQVITNCQLAAFSKTLQFDTFFPAKPETMDPLESRFGIENHQVQVHLGSLSKFRVWFAGYVWFTSFWSASIPHFFQVIRIDLSVSYYRAIGLGIKFSMFGHVYVNVSEVGVWYQQFSTMTPFSMFAEVKLVNLWPRTC